MSHINVSMPGISGSSGKLLRITDFDGGVAFCRFDGQLSPSQSPYMRNLVFRDNALRTRFGQERLEMQMPVGGLHSVSNEMFFGYYVFHIGGALCAFDGKVIVNISEELPDCKSFMFEMNSRLYIFCACRRVFSIGSSLEISEEAIPVPQVMYDAKYDLSEFTVGEEPDNILIWKISVSYREREAGIQYYKLPTECEPGSEIDFLSLKTGNILKPSYTINGDTVEITSSAITSPCKITYTPKSGGKYGHSDKIFGCTTTVCYGGYAGGGTRVFFAGNKDYPGYYYHSELLSPLTVRELSYDILGNGSENINRLAKQKGELIALCDRSIYGITYSFESDSGPDFIIREINSVVGCDIPGSVQLIDNRLVFANSGSGVYIIVSSDYTDELSIRSISANINGTGDGEGMLCEDVSLLKSGLSVDFGRKYYLVSGSGSCYVWDYGLSPYVPSANPSKSEKGLSWYCFDGIGEGALFEIGGELFGVLCDDNENGMVHLSSDITDDFGEPISAVYRSCEFDLGTGEAKKVLRELYMNLIGKDDAAVELTVIADGERIMSETFELYESADASKEKLCRILMKVHGYEAYRFSFELRSKSGVIGIYDAALKFRSDGICYR